MLMSQLLPVLVVSNMECVCVPVFVSMSVCVPPPPAKYDIKQINHIGIIIIVQ
jgi:hypothetical protein